MMLSRRRFGRLLIVLACDLAGVATIALVALAVSHRATDATTHADAALVGAAAAIGSAAWLLAIVAVAGAANGLSAHAARRWVWAGLVLNTVGSVVVAVTAAVVVGPGPDDGLRIASTGLVVGLVLGVAGAGLSLAYLLLLRTPHDVAP